MDGAFLYLMAPEPLPQASMALTTLYDSTSPSGTAPKTTCLPSSHEVTTVVTKNWEPLLCQHGLVHVCFGWSGALLTCWGRRWPWTA